MQPHEIHNRYKTQMLLPHFGLEAQQQLLHAKVLLIGAGGLACPCVQFLAAAGVGFIGICDADTVEISNLHRQILFATKDIGRKKVDVVKSVLQEMNPSLQIETFDTFLDNQLAMRVFPQYDVIIDCTDDMATRFLINDACVLLAKPLVYGAVFQYEGQVAVFNADEQSINLRDVFSEQHQEEVSSCNVSGTLGAVTGIVGTMQALETIKWITKSGGLLANQMLICNFISYHHYKFSVPKSPNKGLPRTLSDFINKDYRQVCENIDSGGYELSAADFYKKIETGNVQVIDVRNHDELPVVDYFKSERIPLNDLLRFSERADRNKTILLFCHAGVRSRTALEFLREECHLKEVYHLKGGIIKWNRHE